MKIQAANRLIKSVDSSTPMLRAAHEGAVAALNGQPQSDNPYKGKPRLWRAWNEGWRKTAVKHDLPFDDER
jgi:ribosome modulation factor